MKKILIIVAILLVRADSAGAITVTYPNGGEVLTCGSWIEVRWTTPTPTTKISLSVLKGGKAVSGPTSLYATGTSKGWYASWKVPATLTAGADYRIKLEDPKTGASDQSDANFTIAVSGVTVELPRAGSTLYITNEETIRWNAYGTPQKMRILLTKDGAIIHHLAENQKSSGSFSWIVGKNYTVDEFALDPGKYQIRIESMDGKLHAESGLFSIARPTLTISYPNGGESFNRDDRCAVSWSSKHLGGDVKIELWSAVAGKSAKFFDTIVASTPNDKSHIWTVFPRPPFGVGEIVPTYSGPWKICIRSVRCPEIWDMSNASFKIKLP